MTVHAKLTLLVAIEGGVAGGALGFDVGMTRYNVTGHHQRFQLCLCNVKTEGAKH